MPWGSSSCNSLQPTNPLSLRDLHGMRSVAFLRRRSRRCLSRLLTLTGVHSAERGMMRHAAEVASTVLLPVQLSQPLRLQQHD